MIDDKLLMDNELKIIAKSNGAQNANIKLPLLLLFFISTYAFTFAQRKIEGKYYIKEKEMHIECCATDTYTFYSNGIFDYAEEGELGIVHYGKGHYTLTKDSLVLNYDLTEVKYPGYYIAKPYTNYKDYITLNLTVYDLEKKPLPNVDVSLFKEGAPTGGDTDENGKLIIKVPKTNEKCALLLIYNHESMYKVESIDLNLCYDLEFYLTKTPMSFFDIGNAIKDEVSRFKIVKLRGDEFVVRNDKKGEITFKKVEDKK